MFTIDEIRVEGEEDGFHLVIYTDDPNRITHRYRIGLPDQFHAEVQRTIGQWLAEGETARAQTLSGSGRLTDSGYENPRAYNAPGSAYALYDPKHQDYHDNMSAIYDNREGK